MKSENIEKIFEILTQTITNPETELEYNNSFQLLVAVVLSAQATDKSVNIATKELFEICTTPQDFINLGEEKLKDYIKTIGLFNNKAKFIIETSKILVNKFNSKIPDNFEDLTSLPGVGRKSANVLLNVVFDKETIGVDTHIFRVSNRIGLVSAQTVEKTEEELLKVIPKDYLKNAHHLIVLHGRYVCKAKKPACNTCEIEKYCEYENKNLTKENKDIKD